MSKFIGIFLSKQIINNGNTKQPEFAKLQIIIS